MFAYKLNSGLLLLPVSLKSFDFKCIDVYLVFLPLVGLQRFTKGGFLQQIFIFSFCKAQQTQSLVSTFTFCSLDVVQIVCWRVKLSKFCYRFKSGLLLLSFKSYDC